MSACVKTLDQLGIANQAHVLSAHRTPDTTAKFAREAADRGIRVMIAAAGGAAHLAGVISAYTWLPVSGFRFSRRPCTVWTRSFRLRKCREAFPLATLAIGSAGAKNAALLAAAISHFPTRRFAKIFRRFAKSRLKRCSPRNCRSEDGNRFRA